MLVCNLNICEIKFRKIFSFKKYLILINSVNVWVTIKQKNRDLSRRAGFVQCWLVHFFFFLQWNLSKGIKDFSHSWKWSGFAMSCACFLYIFFPLLKPLWGERVTELRCNRIIMALWFSLASYWELPESWALMSRGLHIIRRIVTGCVCGGVGGEEGLNTAL